MELWNFTERLEVIQPAAKAAAVIGFLAILLTVVVHTFELSPRAAKEQKSKGERAKEMKQVFETVGPQNEHIDANAKIQASKDCGAPTMKITQLWVYPIKSLRGCSVPHQALTREGFSLDRKFMLLKETAGPPRKLESMHVSNIASMCLFQPTVHSDKLVITYNSPKSAPECISKTLEIPLVPSNFTNLKTLDVNMYNSPTVAFEMGKKYNDWFSDCFGFRVVLAYWGGNTRQVLGNLPGRPATDSPKPRNALSRTLRRVPLAKNWFEEEHVIAFNDCAPYLVISETSVADVTKRLPGDQEMDITKFRANIVVKGSTDAWDEDFWGELLVGAEGTRIILTANCGRCNSLNVDHDNGEFGEGDKGSVLKVLMKDRRVDPGMKWSPVVGRYGFVAKDDEGKVVRVGDDIVIERRLEKRTRFYWPGMSTN